MPISAYLRGLAPRSASATEGAYVMSVFECRRLGGTLRADAEETLDARYFTAEQVPGLELSTWARALLPTLLALRGGCWIPPVTWQPPRSSPPA